jgi:hypothetical protein
MAIGRDGLAPSELLRHDISTFAALWAALIALTCVMAGLLATVIARQAGAGRTIAAVCGGVGSLLPLSWLITGYPMQFGFFNSHIALPIVIAGVLAFLSWRASPAAALSLLMLTATLLLAVWSPLVLLPRALGVAVVIGGWRGILAARGIEVAILALSAAQLTAYGLGAMLPVLLATGESLGVQGGSISFPALMLPVAAMGVSGLAFAATRKVRNPVVVGAVALSCASVLGLAILLVVSSGWTYYPSKFAWLTSVVLALFIPGLLLPAMSRVTTRVVPLVAASTILTLAAVAVIPIAPTFEDGHRRQHPIEWLLSNNGSTAEEVVANRILELADLSQPRVLWESKEPGEGTINFWLLQVAADSLDNNFQLRVYAYEAFRMTGAESLCEILGVMDGRVEVLTANPDLEAEMNIRCPSREFNVVVR